MTDNIYTTILEELRALRSEIGEYTRVTGERLVRLETQTASLYGNGQPGRVSVLEKAVQRLQEWKYWVVGVSAGVGGVVSVVAWFLTPRR